LILNNSQRGADLLACCRPIAFRGAPDVLGNQSRRPTLRGQLAIRRRSNSDNRSAMTHLPIDPTRSKGLMR
jgi:hypothetical protein